MSCFEDEYSFFKTLDVSKCLRQIRSLASSRQASIVLKYNHQHKDEQGCSVEAVSIIRQVSPLF